MLFGAIPMQIKSENTKIHYLPTDRQIMVSKLFQVGIRRPSSAMEAASATNQDEPLQGSGTSSPIGPESSSGGSTTSNNDSNSTSKSRPINAPTPKDEAPNMKARSMSASSFSNSLLSRFVQGNTVSRQGNGGGASASGRGGNPLDQGPMKNSKSSSDLASVIADSSIGSRSLGGGKPDRASSNENLFMCRSLFGLAIVFTFPSEETPQNSNNTHGEDGGPPRPARSDEISMDEIQQLFFSHFAIIELRTRSVLKACIKALRYILTKAVDHAAQVGEEVCAIQISPPHLSHRSEQINKQTNKISGFFLRTLLRI